MRLFFILQLIMSLTIFNALGQRNIKDSISVEEHLLKTPYVYLDCRGCDADYIKTELTFVNYVRDPEMADIHVFLTDERTAAGGEELQFSFIGQKKFEGTSYTLKHHISPNATIDERRKIIKEYLNMGFASYMLQTPLGINFSISYSDSLEIEQKTQADDPWNFWIFQAYIGGLELEMESNQTIFDSRWGIFADHVSEEWKLRFRPYFNFDLNNIQTSDNDEPVISRLRRHGIDSYAIKSLNDHWSAGVFGTYYTFNGNNIRNRVIISPGIEYSIFPYELATRKSITFAYLAGYGYYDYYETTIFDKNEENLFHHSLRGAVNIQQPWGSVETGLIGSHFLHDFSKGRIELYAESSVRLFEGFALRFEVEYEVIRDQISLPRGEASLEDVLLQQRELATDFSFSTEIALTYTFGSKYTNIVNTRFYGVD
ncbi:MAG: hypothetical protein ACP5E3_12940 [Bacteroidales bacterium]